MELPHTQRSTPAPEKSAGGCAGAPDGSKGTAGSPARPSPRQQRRGQAPAGPSNSTSRRNERERNRVKLVNLGFANLQRHVPPRGPSKRMSKVDTLRSAVEYIRGLEVLLRDQGSGASEGSPSSAADRGSLSDSPLSSYSSEDASRDSVYSEREFTSYKDWLGIE